MSNEVVAGKFQKISYSERVKLSIITLVHHRFGMRIEAHLPVSRLRLLYLLYLADLEYYRQNGEVYLGSWIYANHGPLLQHFDASLHDLDGLEITKGKDGYAPGRHLKRYTTWKLDSKFDQILVEIKQQCYFMTIGGIKKLVYASLPMQNAVLGDCLFK